LLRAASVVVLVLTLAAAGLLSMGAMVAMNRADLSGPVPTLFAPAVITMMVGVALAATVEGIARVVGRRAPEPAPIVDDVTPAVDRLAAAVGELRRSLPMMLADLRPPPTPSTPVGADPLFADDGPLLHAHVSYDVGTRVQPVPQPVADSEPATELVRAGPPAFASMPEPELVSPILDVTPSPLPPPPLPEPVAPLLNTAPIRIVLPPEPDVSDQEIVPSEPESTNEPSFELEPLPHFHPTPDYEVSPAVPQAATPEPEFDLQPLTESHATAEAELTVAESPVAQPEPALAAMGESTVEPPADEGLRLVRDQAAKDRRKLERVSEAAGLIQRNEWEQADALLTLLESLHPGDPDVLAQRNLLDDVRVAAREAEWGQVFRRVEDLLALSRYDEAAVAVSAFRKSHPTHVDAAGMGAQIAADRDAYVERTAHALYQDIKTSVEARQWRMALDGIQRFLSRFPSHARADRIRQQVRTIQNNAEIEERHEQENRIKDLARAGRFGEAADLCEDLLGRFPSSPTAPNLRTLLPRLRERSAIASVD
jgi:outer membrane protein assembly factor BamD (BamD/ComL family)